MYFKKEVILLNLNVAEIEILRLAGWLKGLPQELHRFDTYLLSAAGTEALCHYGLLHVTKNGQYLRLTPAGWDMLSTIGYPYPQDAKYSYFYFKETKNVLY